MLSTSSKATFSDKFLLKNDDIIVLLNKVLALLNVHALGNSRTVVPKVCVKTHCEEHKAAVTCEHIYIIIVKLWKGAGEFFIWWWWCVCV